MPRISRTSGCIRPAAPIPRVSESSGGAGGRRPFPHGADVRPRQGGGLCDRQRLDALDSRRSLRQSQEAAGFSDKCCAALGLAAGTPADMRGRSAGTLRCPSSRIATQARANVGKGGLGRAARKKAIRPRLPRAAVSGTGRRRASGWRAAGGGQAQCRRAAAGQSTARCQPSVFTVAAKHSRLTLACASLAAAALVVQARRICSRARARSTAQLPSRKSAVDEAHAAAAPEATAGRGRAGQWLRAPGPLFAEPAVPRNAQQPVSADMQRRWDGPVRAPQAHATALATALSRAGSASIRWRP